MKHIRHFFLMAVLLLGTLSVSAETVEIGGIWYYLDAETLEATVERSGGLYYSDYSGSITIPAVVTYEDNTYRVTSIGYGAFEDCENLTSITIPEGVTAINDGAFEGCSGLSSVAVPEGVTEIGRSAFYRCSGLVSVTFPESLTLIGDEAFYDCSSLTSITFPASVTSIGNDAFYDCSGLTAVHISSMEAWCNINFGNIKFGNSSANPLRYAENLYLNGELVTELVIPEGVTEIGDCAFYGCGNLTSITIPEGVTSIGDHAFHGCGGVTSIILPESLTSIGEWAFSSCQRLTSITIPASVTEIKDAAFNLCTGLTSIIIPAHSRLASIGESAFSWCLSLRNITVPEGVTNIKRRVFDSCRRLTSITIPEGVTKIGEAAFSDCSTLTSITCCAVTPPTCESTSFSGVPSSIPVNVPENSASAYQGAEVWKDFTRIIAGAPVLSQYSAILFEGKSLTLTASPILVTAPDKSLTWSSSNPEVAVVDAEGNVTAVAIGTAFITVAVNKGQGVSASCEVTVKKTPVLSIEELNDTVLYHIYTPRGSWAVAEGGDRLVTNDDLDIDINSADPRQQFAFVSNDGVSYYLYHVAEKKFVNWDGTLSQAANVPVYFKAGAYENTFMIYFNEGCYINIGGSNQLTIDGWNTPDDGNSYTILPVGECKPFASVVDAILYSQIAEGEAEVVNGQQVSGDVEIPETVMIGGENCKVVSIREGAFYSCSSLTSITLPKGLTKIGFETFYGCLSLNSITIPEGVTSIGNRAFASCRALPSVSIPGSVTEIGDYAFYDCNSLTAITIPEGVTSIGEEAFCACSSLTALNIPASVTTIGKEAFYGCNGLTAIIVDENNNVYDSRNNCNAIIETNSNTLIVGCVSTVIPEGVTSIGESAFSGYSGLTAVIIPEGVTSIGDYAFAGCSGLTAITIPASVTSIGDYAFYGCNSLERVVLNCTDVHGWFGSNSAIKEIVLGENVATVADDAFRRCDSIERVTMDCPMVGSWFSGKATIKEIVLGDNVVEIEGGAFENCDSLVSITLGSGLSVIKDRACYNCSSLSSITCHAVTPPTCSGLITRQFYGVDKAIPVYVPAASVASYQSAKCWKEFTNIIGTNSTSIEHQELGTQSPNIIYDLRGRRVTHPEKGIYIVNGCKVLIGD